MFIDKAVVKVIAGAGGNGAVSFRHEKFIDKGGPDGGDGGRGGSIIFQADRNQNTLAEFRFTPELKAKKGENGTKRNRHGKNGKDLIVLVATGTQVVKHGEVIADFVEHGQKAIIAKGGDGGFGNAHFKSSIRQTPRVAEKGEAGDEFELTLELKLIADVGLVGLPNAGKSTFLSVTTNATPEVADYAFTTLTPHLGVADFDGTSLLIADIPGLIEGASSGKGLGHEFLRHVERTGVLLHLVDAYSNNVAEAYNIIRNELKRYSDDLAGRPEIVAITKTEGLDDEFKDDLIEQLKTVTKSPVLAISSQAHQNINKLLRELKASVDKQKLALEEQGDEDNEASASVVYTLADDELAWHVEKINDNKFKITGRKIEKFARRTDFENYHSRQRIRDIMKKMGILHELSRKGAEPNSQLLFGRQQESLTLIEQD